VAEGLGRPTGKGILVGVIDSGWDRACDDPRVLPGIGLVDPADDLAMLRSDDDRDRVGHGTACIHQILRIAPDAQVVPIRVFGNGLETSPGTLQAGILYAIERGVKVVNLSLGTTLEGTLHPLYAACEKARRQGIIVVAAGHNSNDWSYPAIFDGVIGVSAGRFGSPYDFRYLVDDAMECQAWGVEQPVVWLGGSEQVKHGTSFAAPNITGIVCLLLERHPGATLEQVRELLAGYATEVVISLEVKAARARAKAAKAEAKAKAAEARAKVARAKAKVARAKAELAKAKAEVAEAKAAEAKAAEAAKRAAATPKPQPKAIAEPAKTSPVEPGPRETEPAKAAPAGSGPTKAKPAKTAPAESRSTEAKPAKTAPARSRSTEAKPAKTASAGSRSKKADARTSDAPEAVAPSPRTSRRRARASKTGRS